MNATARRWLHISRTEHCCSDCYDTYACQQTDEWTQAGVTAGDGLLEYIVSKHLPYWVQCECGMWRPLPLHADASQLAIRAKCPDGGCAAANSSAAGAGGTCSPAGAERFDDTPLVDLEVWIGEVSEAAQQRLVGDFYQRAMTARELLSCQQSLEKSGREGGPACLPYAHLTKAEAAELTDLAAPCRRIYVNLRNLLLWRWSLDDGRYLTMREAAAWVRVRGAVRR